MLSEAFRKLAQRSAVEVQQMRERFAAHVASHDAVEFDVGSGVVVYRAAGRPLWQARAILLAKLNADLRLFGWWWHGQTTWTGSGPFEAIVLAGDRDGVAEFHTDALSVSDEDEAFALAELAGALCEAHGVSFTRSGSDLSFWALFDAADSPRLPSVRPPARATPTSPFASVRPAPPSGPPEEGAGRYSITEPPPAVPSASSGPARPARGGTVPPKEARAEPPPPEVTRVPRAPRLPELPSRPASSPPGVAPAPPSREAFARIADLAMEAARKAQADGVSQVLVVASVDPQGGGRRLAVHLVALASGGKLVCVDVPRELVNAIAKLAADAAHARATRWKRLVARIADGEHGFSFEIEMT